LNDYLTNQPTNQPTNQLVQKNVRSHRHTSPIQEEFVKKTVLFFSDLFFCRSKHLKGDIRTRYAASHSPLSLDPRPPPALLRPPRCSNIPLAPACKLWLQSIPVGNQGRRARIEHCARGSDSRCAHTERRASAKPDQQLAIRIQPFVIHNHADEANDRNQFLEGRRDI